VRVCVKENETGSESDRERRKKDGERAYAQKTQRESERESERAREKERVRER